MMFAHLPRQGLSKKCTCSCSLAKPLIKSHWEALWLCAKDLVAGPFLFSEHIGFLFPVRCFVGPSLPITLSFLFFLHLKSLTSCDMLWITKEWYSKRILDVWKSKCSTVQRYVIVLVTFEMNSLIDLKKIIRGSLGYKGRFILRRALVLVVVVVSFVERRSTVLYTFATVSSRNHVTCSYVGKTSSLHILHN